MTYKYCAEECLSASDQHERKFRMTFHTPMASNLVLALYQCGSQYRIKTFVQEDVTEIPGCPLDENDTCSYDDFAALFDDWADSCTFEEVCAI